MPFTLAHAAAVLPLRKTRLPLAAMMIGSMSPDFSYFTPMTIGLRTHTLGGMFWFCWPVGLLVWLLYVRVLEPPSIALLPDGWRTRVTPSESALTASLLLRVSIAILVGAATHILWDAFTHSETPVTGALPGLREVTVEIFGRPLAVYRFLQYLSSVLGMAALVIWAWRQRPVAAPALHDPGARLSNKLRLGSVLLLIASSCVVALAYLAPHSHIPFGRQLFFLLIGAMTGWALAWCGIALLVSRRLRAPYQATSTGGV